ncbi:PepSY domain-containing protein [Neisseriaceae bacterium B1]
MKLKRTLLTTVALFAVSAPALADNDDLIYQQNSSQFITHEKARDVAIEAVGGGTVKDGDVDFEHSAKHGDYFEVEVLGKDGKEYDVKIDAKTGKVLHKA